LKHGELVATAQAHVLVTDVITSKALAADITMLERSIHQLDVSILFAQEECFLVVAKNVSDVTDVLAMLMDSILVTSAQSAEIPDEQKQIGQLPAIQNIVVV
jgi:hypothetical protein